MSTIEVNPPPVAVTITAADRTIDADVPARMPLAEALPVLARKLGVLDAAIVHGGFRLLAPHGAPLPLDRSLAELDIAPGTHLTLEVSLLVPDPVVYDDIVEAVGDVVARETAPWTPQDGAMTASVLSTGILLIAALSLAAIPSTPALGYLTLGTAVLVLVMAAATAIRGHSGPAMLTGAMGVLFAAIGGYHAIRGGWPEADYAQAMVGVGGAMVLSGTAGAAAIRDRWVYATAPIAAGLILASASTICWVDPGSARAVWPITLAAIGVTACGLPWISLTTARLAVDSPQSDAEIFAIPNEIDAETVAARYRRGNQWLVAGRMASLAVVACVAPLVVAVPSPAGVVLVAAVLGAMMLGTRSIVERRDVLMVMAGSGVCALGAVIAATAAHPTWRPAIAGVLSAVALVVVALMLIAGSRSLRAARIADSMESLCLVLIFPSALVAAGIVGG